MRKKYLYISMAVAMASTTLTSCNEDTLSTILNIVDIVLGDDGQTTITTEDGHGLGWLEGTEDTESIEDDIVLKPAQGSEIDQNTGLPTSVDLSVYLPPIGDQGQFGTCVAWATGYNARTWLYAKSQKVKGKSLSQDHIFSPADLFRSVDNANKGTKCQGTAFEYALDVLVKRGIATMATVPNIKSESECNCATSSTAEAEAQRYKIASYREIDVKEPRSIKRYLSEGRIVLFGAKLGDTFMLSDGKSIINNHSSFNYTGMHAYHAMVCVGYDDNKGPNGAFKVVNSWGESWGDRGTTWVDQKFFCSGEFTYCGFILNNGNETENQPTEGEEKTDITTSENDLVATLCNDIDYNEEDDPDSEDPRWRTLYYDAANAGTGTVLASDTWGICYMLYNAYNANESEIVLFDLYSDKIGNIQKGECNNNWDPDIAKSILGCDAQGFSISNIDIPGKTSVAAAVTGDPEQCFSWSYKMPKVTGKYYLVLAVDAFNSIEESNDENNYYFLMSSDQKPLEFQDGVLVNTIAANKALSFRRVIPKQNAVMPNQTAVNDKCPNTYTPAEIASVIDAQRREGVIANKAAAFLEQNGGRVKPRRIVKYNQN